MRHIKWLSLFWQLCVGLFFVLDLKHVLNMNMAHFGLWTRSSSNKMFDRLKEGCHYIVPSVSLPLLLDIIGGQITCFCFAY